VLDLAGGVDAADVGEPLRLVDVAALERKPLFGPQAGAGDDDRQRRAEVRSDRFHVLPRLEHLNFSPLRLRVLDLAGDVLGHVAAGNRVLEDLAEGFVDVPGRAFGEPLAPGADLGHLQALEPLPAESSRDVFQAVGERVDRVLLGDVLR
jgi:hypothetical protein